MSLLPWPKMTFALIRLIVLLLLFRTWTDTWMSSPWAYIALLSDARRCILPSLSRNGFSTSDSGGGMSMMDLARLGRLS